MLMLVAAAVLAAGRNGESLSDCGMGLLLGLVGNDVNTAPSADYTFGRQPTHARHRLRGGCGRVWRQARILSNLASEGTARSLHLQW